MKTKLNTLPRWKRPDSYFGAEWPEYFVFLGRNRDSDCLTESNFDTALEALGGESETVLVIRENHWACGWIEWIAIHESDMESLHKASEISLRLEDYPVLDENDFSEREQEDADRVWKDCYDVKERIAYIRRHPSQFEFHDWPEIRAVVKGEYFIGYASDLIN